MCGGLGPSSPLPCPSRVMLMPLSVLRSRRGAFASETVGFGRCAVFRRVVVAGLAHTLAAVGSRASCLGRCNEPLAVPLRTFLSFLPGPLGGRVTGVPVLAMGLDAHPEAPPRPSGAGSQPPWVRAGPRRPAHRLLSAGSAGAAGREGRDGRRGPDGKCAGTWPWRRLPFRPSRRFSVSNALLS